jgi:hypothetical protein
MVGGSCYFGSFAVYNMSTFLWLCCSSLDLDGLYAVWYLYRWPSLVMILSLELDVHLFIFLLLFGFRLSTGSIGGVFLSGYYWCYFSIGSLLVAFVMASCRADVSYSVDAMTFLDVEIIIIMIIFLGGFYTHNRIWCVWTILWICLAGMDSQRRSPCRILFETVSARSRNPVILFLDVYMPDCFIILSFIMFSRYFVVRNVYFSYEQEHALCFLFPMRNIFIYMVGARTSLVSRLYLRLRFP